MAVDPLNPARPTLLDESIELPEELRAIKRRLVQDKEDLDQLKNTFAGINSLTPYMAAMLSKASANEALAHLTATAVGIDVLRMTSWENLAIALGVANPTPSFSTGTQRWCLQLPGGFKLNFISGSLGDQSLQMWQTPFTQACLGAVGTCNIDDNRSVQVYSFTNSACNVSFSGGGSIACTIIGFGF